jgi:hypothetical protein
MWIHSIVKHSRRTTQLVSVPGVHFLQMSQVVGQVGPPADLRDFQTKVAEHHHKDCEGRTRYAFSYNMMDKLDTKMHHPGRTICAHACTRT